MNTQIRKFYEMEDGGGGSIDWYKQYCLVNKELSELKKVVTEKDLIIHGVEEGSQNWKAEYDNCRKLLQDIIDAESHQWHRSSPSNPSQLPLVLIAAKDFLKTYQHEGW